MDAPLYVGATPVLTAHWGSHAAERERARRSRMCLCWLRPPRRQQHSAHSAGLCWLSAVLCATIDVEVSEPAAAADILPGGCCCSTCKGPAPAIISCAFSALVPLIIPTCVPQRAQAASLGASERPPSRAGCSVYERPHVEVSARSRRWVGWGG